MATTINADNGVVSGTPGLKQSSDSSGVLELQSSGTTGVSINPNGKIILANTALATATAGTLEYNGLASYFTPLGTQRGIIPGMQFYVLGSPVVGSNATGAQSLLGVGVTVSSDTIYAYEILSFMSKSAGTTSHTYSISYGGTATIASNQVYYNVIATNNGTLVTNSPVGNYTTVFPTVTTGNISSSAYAITTSIKGILRVTSTGTYIPQYSLSAAPGGAYTTLTNSYMLIYPIGKTSDATVNIGTWA